MCWLMVRTPESGPKSKDFNSGQGHYIVVLGMTLYQISAYLDLAPGV